MEPHRASWSAKDTQAEASQRVLRLPVGVLRLATQELTELELGEPLGDKDFSALSDVVLSLQQFMAKVRGAHMANDRQSEISGNPAGRVDQPAGAHMANDTQNDISGKSAGRVDQRAGLEEPFPIKTTRTNGRITQSLVDIFTSVDVDGSGTWSIEEVRKAMLAVGIPRARVSKLFSLADADSSGRIDIDEWMFALQRDGVVSDITVFSQEMNYAKKLKRDDAERSSLFMLHPLSTVRFAWDTLVGLMCLYIAIFSPFVYAFHKKFDDLGRELFGLIDGIIDVAFIVDICLNFRTGYFETTDYHGPHAVMDWKAAGRHYMKTWFPVDAISAIPLGFFVDEKQLTKVIKLSKLAKVIKLSTALPFQKLERFHWFEHILQVAWIRFFYRRGIVLVAMISVCHWMACALKVADQGYLANYAHQSLWTEYGVAAYWAMTTLTTVGYGDITPTTDEERVFTIFAMVVGGTFYGILVGSISSMVAQSDLNATAFYERMDLVYAWSSHHALPNELKTLVCRFFRLNYSRKSAIAESDLWNELTPELQKELGAYIVHEDVRYNPIFDGVPLSAVVRVQSVLHTFVIFAGRHITITGDAGSDMFIISSGTVLLEMLEMEAARVVLGDETQEKYERALEGGDCFGEEVLLAFEHSYQYTTTAIEDSVLESIRQEELLQLFQAMPHVLERMRANVSEFSTAGSARRFLERRRRTRCALQSHSIRHHTSLEPDACFLRAESNQSEADL
eukprot:TRINITY_DN12043_c0_g2_i1.p1 TRINITY_DN12043_c0_g2~~TRINITY_DN12043_c0_g2_i1.p1  ORF type:complete len:745 (-),score=119.41 TRINITY_DN12043_c0_g2_i1:94-2301(-)